MLICNTVARASSVRQTQEKTIDSQIASIIEHANSLGEKIEPELYFIDDDIIGASLERPGLDRLRTCSESFQVC